MMLEPFLNTTAQELLNRLRLGDYQVLFEFPLFISTKYKPIIDNTHTKYGDWDLLDANDLLPLYLRELLLTDLAEADLKMVELLYRRMNELKKINFHLSAEDEMSIVRFWVEGINALVIKQNEPDLSKRLTQIPTKDEVELQISDASKEIDINSGHPINLALRKYEQLMIHAESKHYECIDKTGVLESYYGFEFLKYAFRVNRFLLTKFTTKQQTKSLHLFIRQMCCSAPNTKLAQEFLMLYDLMDKIKYKAQLFNNTNKSHIEAVMLRFLSNIEEEIVSLIMIKTPNRWPGFQTKCGRIITETLNLLTENSTLSVLLNKLNDRINSLVMTKRAQAGGSKITNLFSWFKPTAIMETISNAMTRSAPEDFKQRNQGFHPQI